MGPGHRYPIILALFILPLGCGSGAEAVDSSEQAATNGLVWEANTALGLSVFEGLERSPGTIDIVKDPTGKYGNVYHFDVWDNPNHVKSRCEVRGTVLPDGKAIQFHEGDSWYLGWRSLWDKNVGTEPNRWVALFQMHGYGHTGSGAPLVIRTLGDGEIHLQNNPDGINQDLWTAPMVREEWQTFVLHVHISADPSKGWVELWHNGVRQTLSNGKQRFYTALLDADPSSYDLLKWGLYRTGAATGNWNAYMSDAKLGTTYASVSP
jgi:hypothetical protein